MSYPGGKGGDGVYQRLIERYAILDALMAVLDDCPGPLATNTQDCPGNPATTDQGGLEENVFLSV